MEDFVHDFFERFFGGQRPQEYRQNKQEIWIALNSFLLLKKPFDLYPFILLNLVLSCLAAIQAPAIMMSQNRQEVKDRLRSQHDYHVNLNAELEIRQLHDKIDHLLSHL